MGAIDERFTETIIVDSLADYRTPHITSYSEERVGVADGALTEEVASQEGSSDIGVGQVSSKMPPTWGSDRGDELTPRDDSRLYSTGHMAMAADKKPTGSESLPEPENDKPVEELAVKIGSTVRLEKLGKEGGKMEVTLVDEGHDVERGRIGQHTPLGRALLDAEVGDTVEYRAGPYLNEVLILSISPALRSPEPTQVSPAPEQ